MRIFLAHKKGVEDAEIERHRTAVIEALKADGVDDVQVVTGLEDFNANIASDGSFDAWARGVIDRRDTFTGKRIYDAVFSIGYTLGKATSTIIGAAFHAGVPVVVSEALDGGSIEFRGGTQLVVDDADDYVSGWWIDTN